MAVTIHDIAELAHVDASTVSRALRGDVRVRLETRNRICRLAEEMSYIPNRGARQLAGGSSQLIAFSSGQMSSEFIAPVTEAMNQELSEFGYMLTILPEAHTGKSMSFALKLFEQRFCDAAVFYSPVITPEHHADIDVLLRRNFPVVCIDQWNESYPFPVVTNDAAKSIDELGRCMLEHGVNAVAVWFPAENTVSLFRRREAVRFLRENNIPYVTELQDIPELLRRYPGCRFGIFANNPHVDVYEDDTLAKLMAANPPSMCIGGMFDSWKFDAPKCFDVIYLCIQDANAYGKIAGEYVVRLLRGDRSVDKMTLVPPLEIIKPFLK